MKAPTALCNGLMNESLGSRSQDTQGSLCALNGVQISPSAGKGLEMRPMAHRKQKDEPLTLIRLKTVLLRQPQGWEQPKHPPSTSALHHEAGQEEPAPEPEGNWIHPCFRMALAARRELLGRTIHTQLLSPAP